MFSHPLDPPSVTEARRVEEAHIVRWVEQARARAAQRRGGGGALVRPAAAQHEALYVVDA